jgi:hypothetical protein
MADREAAMAMSRLALVGIALLALAGCASVPKVASAPRSAPAAEIVVVKGHQSGFGYAGSQTYMLSQNGQCTDSRQIATLLWTTSASKAVRIPQARIVVLATTTYFSSMGAETGAQGGATGMKSCVGAVAFTARQDHSYEVTQKAPYYGSGCHMEVTDKTTGRPPEDLRKSDHGTCEDFTRP